MKATILNFKISRIFKTDFTIICGKGSIKTRCEGQRLPGDAVHAPGSPNPTRCDGNRSALRTSAAAGSHAVSPLHAPWQQQHAAVSANTLCSRYCNTKREATYSHTAPCATTPGTPPATHPPRDT